MGLKTCKIVCVGRNYVEHIEELGNKRPDSMVLFIKPFSALSDSLSSIHLGDQVHYEGELALLYEGGKISATAFAMDLTKREVQNKLKEKGLPWERSKAFKGSVLFTPFVPLLHPLSELVTELYIDGELIQRGEGEKMIYPPSFIVAEVDSIFGLDDGDILLCGTPKGVGPLKKGSIYRGIIKWNDQILTQMSWIAN